MSARACEIVCNILETWPSVSTDNIATIREIVLKKKFTGAAGLSDDGLVALVGESFQEMRFLHIKLGITFDKVVADNEMWYISEWLKENRINDRRVKDSSVRELSHFLGTEIYEYAEATGSGNVKLKDFLKRAKGFSIK
ncbi:hypothetical protein [uncultured Prevotella sp.]|uniref:hypothetical protein n=1 Tax=uncultured Prevotella sp. TaxID=159272 RepID=UPI002672D45A|nr:hypothetical protein [uncultured Prevotella sp.]